MKRAVVGLLLGHAIITADAGCAQTISALGQAEKHADAGNLVDARGVLSQWFSEASSGATREEVARGRFLRARLAPTAAAAESDYRWLAVEGGEVFGPAARLRLAQLSLVRGDLSGAASALNRLRSDHPGHPVVVHAWLWTGHVAEAGGDAERACEAWRSASRLAGDSTSTAGSSGASAGNPFLRSGSLRPEIEALLRSCDEPGAEPSFAIQFGAFRARGPAEQLTSAVAAAGVAAQVVEAEDGSGWYRVRTAGFTSRAPAERTARILVGRGFEAVVVRVERSD